MSDNEGHPVPPPRGGSSQTITDLGPRDRIVYRLILSADGQPDLEVPMSSWQATVQTGARSFLQAVIPATVDRYSEIIARAGGTMRVYRVARFADTGLEIPQLMAESPIGTIRYDRGGTNASATLSGYWTETAAGPTEVVLSGLRLVSVTSGTRVRASIDWTLRPGNVAIANGAQIPVRYINYYVSPNREFMDVGA